MARVKPGREFPGEKEEAAKRSEEIRFEIAMHKVEHPSCPDPYTHVIRIRHERAADARRRLLDIRIG